MATNVSYASGDTLLEGLVLHTLPSFGPHGDGIINTNFAVSALKAKNRMKVVDGGLEFWNGVMTSENSNFKWQSHTAEMSADLQDPTDRLRFEIMTFTGSIVINKKHEAMNKGRAMMKKWAETQREQAESTIPNQFNSAFWNTSPTAGVEPESIPSLISATPTTGTIGGQTRSTNAAFQNGAYTTAIADIGSEAGIAALMRQKLRYAIGGGGRDCPDIAIMDDNLYSGLQGYLATLNRYRPDDQLAKLGFDTIKLGNMTMSYENTNVKGGANTITAGYVYMINSKYMKFELLKDGNFKWEDKFERVGKSLNKALYFYVFCNLTTNLPCAHVVCTNVSTT